MLIHTMCSLLFLFKLIHITERDQFIRTTHSHAHIIIYTRTTHIPLCSWQLVLDRTDILRGRSRWGMHQYQTPLPAGWERERERERERESVCVCARVCSDRCGVSQPHFIKVLAVHSSIYSEQLRSCFHCKVDSPSVWIVWIVLF